MCPIRNLTPYPDLSADSDDIIQLCIETIANGHSVLIFCPTKNWCEKLALQLASMFFKLGRGEHPLGQILKKQLDVTAITETLEQLKRSPIGLDSVLKNTISFGIGFHHAGLTMDERDIIEGSFRTGGLRVLTATSTLSSGVNLPARRVIIRSPIFNGKPLDTLTYKQMIGRAGRMGKDTAGESILVCKTNEHTAGKILLSASLEPIESCLEGSGPLIRALLEAVASEVAYTAADLNLYTRCTLVNFNQQNGMDDSTKDALQFLVDSEFILLQETETGEQRWVATPLGKACLAASVPPRDGLFLFEELQKARKCFVLDSELHIIYLITPFNSGSQIGQIDWMIFLELWRALSESERRVGQLVGVEERFVMSAVRGTVKTGKVLDIHKRFYTALALHDLVREVPLSSVCQKYGCCRGLLQSLQQSAATFAGMVTQFCKELGWDCLELLVGQFQTRLQFGVCRELLDLLRLPLLNGLRARSLYKEGITNVMELAVANELDVERALYKALPFESGKEQDGEHEVEAARRNKMRTIFVTGRDGLTPHQAAIMLVREARTLIQNELGVEELRWKESQKVKDNQPVKSTSRFLNNSRIDDTAAKCSISLSSRFSQSNTSSVNTSQTAQTHIQAIKQNITESNVYNTSKCCTSVSNSVKGISAVLNSTEIAKSKDEKNVLMKENKENEYTVKNKINEDGKCESINKTVKKSKFRLLRSSKPRKTEKSVEESKETSTLLVNASGNSTISRCSKNNEALIVEKQSVSPIQLTTIPTTNSENIEFVEPSPKASTHSTLKQILSDSQHNHEWSTFKIDDIQSKLESKLVATSRTDVTVTLNQSAVQNVDSRSPSLFGDSFYLDTQACNALEQNVNDILEIPVFEEKNVSSSNQVSTKNLEIQPQSLDQYLLPNDDSWNDTRNLIKKASALKSQSTPGTSKPENCKNKNILNIFDNVEEISATPITKDYSRVKSLTSKSYTLNRKTTKVIKSVTSNTSPKNPKLNAKYLDSEKSPIASVLTFAANRRLSLDSNKSDSDDIIISSQNIEPCVSTSKNRTRSKLETTRRLLATQQMAKFSARKINRLQELKMLEMNTIENALKTSRDIKYTVNDVRKRIGSGNCSTDSIVSNSDEDAPVKKLKTTQKSRNIQPTVKSIPTNITKVRDHQIINLEDQDYWDEEKENLEWNTMSITNVATDRIIFNSFKRHLKSRTEIAMALACERSMKDQITIGTRIIGITSNDDKKKSKKSENYVYDETKLSGVAISWGRKIYYIPFGNVHDTKISTKERISLITDLLSSSSLTVHCFATKDVLKTLYRCCAISPSCLFLDPKTAEWLLNPDALEKSFVTMASEYFPQGLDLLQHAGTCYGSVGSGMDFKSVIAGDTRAAIEVVITWFIMDALLKKLSIQNSTLLDTFKDIEMKAVATLARMELTGLGIHLKSLEELSSVIQQEMSSLEQRAYALAGKKFNFSSSKNIAQILGMYKGKKISTNKAVLEQCENPISSLIISWRKLNSTQTKIVFPLLKMAQSSRRIHGNCVTHTVTGRVSMYEPNLQNVPRDFNSEDNSFVISVRMAFIPTTGNILLSADYCQLELRILAHFSKDIFLCNIMQSEGDVFKSIAAKWNGVTEKEVDDKMRQRTKQLCYAMIYGMGAKALAEHLSVTELEAAEFMETFMATYPDVQQWLKNVIEQARIDGYITTLMGRRRILPALKSSNKAEKSQAERQAVNTKIQGSAADLAKKAMITVEERMKQEFINIPPVLTVAETKRKLRSNSRDSHPRGGFLVLQLHDELLYEVNMADLHRVAGIVKESMEQVQELMVPLPVKIKVGPAWGDLTEYVFNQS
ncbi:DNA polymerase theta isoform X2 [Cephus cinctus]|nr:DNA polymerase theta isoform X2 [Cephus cinctus]